MISIGIGINVFNTTNVTCLQEVLNEFNRMQDVHGKELNLESLLATFYNSFEKNFFEFETNGFNAFLERYYSLWLHRYHDKFKI